MLNALIIFLREVLEAGLIFSALLAAARVVDGERRGLAVGALLGIAGALANARWIGTISDWGDGIGQELLNAALLLAIVALLACYNVGVALRARNRRSRVAGALLFWGSAGAVACAGSRECAEIFIYSSGFATSFAALTPVLIGGAIGAGIGASIAALLYYLLVYLRPNAALLATSLVPALIAAGMAGQAVAYLFQAGLLNAGEPLWDTSMWLAENSAAGQLLYALLGYEATPMPLQLVAYLLALLLVGTTGVARLFTRDANH